MALPQHTPDASAADDENPAKTLVLGSADVHLLRMHIGQSFDYSLTRVADNFFRSHACNSICRDLGLTQGGGKGCMCMVRCFVDDLMAHRHVSHSWIGRGPASTLTWAEAPEKYGTAPESFLQLRFPSMSLSAW